MIRAMRRGLAATLCLAATGCSAMREIPRTQYAAEPERQDVRVQTRAGKAYQFERARISGDSLQGYRRLDVEGRFEQFETVPLALEEVGKMSVRRVDWYRTGILLGVGAAVLVVVLLNSGRTAELSQPPGPCGPRPCP